MIDAIILILLIIAAYLLGSIPSSVWIGKRFYGIDVREHGSKNAGATNTLRTLGRRAALAVFVIDFSKGFAAVMLSFASDLVPYSEEFIYLRIGLVIAATIGHIFPIFANFRGGKGVATVSGCMIALAPFPLLMSLGVFFIVLLITHYVSLGSVLGGLSFPLFVYLRFVVVDEPVSPTLLIFSGVASLMILITHRNNFKRLVQGTESKTHLFRKREKAE